ncbi:hypothetical protein PV328_008374 [Microctonus aethiopoides]|uniref:Uncharacterized protein n=1 Tax=Microctonus aethiopoides TaxID=144406 RepID=A0AA39FJG1_9HYME|nr:hypothetical protein PV328_008374 [Microctonus aethiopoides]
MTSMKRSLLYNFQMKTDEIKNALIVEINQAKVPVFNCTEARAGVGVALPIKNLDDFITFDEALNEDEEKKSPDVSLSSSGVRKIQGKGLYIQDNGRNDH